MLVLFLVGVLPWDKSSSLKQPPIPPEKVFGRPKHTYNTFSGIWMSKKPPSKFKEYTLGCPGCQWQMKLLVGIMKLLVGIMKLLVGDNPKYTPLIWVSQKKPVA